MRGRKRTVCLLALSMCVSGLAGGCAGQTSIMNTARNVQEVRVTPPGDYPISEQKTTLSVFTAPESSFVENYDTNEFTKWYENKTNVHIKWTVSQTGTVQSKNAILASGNYPEVFLDSGISRSEQYIYGQRGVLLDLTELIENNTVYIKKLLQERPDIRAALTAPDGKIYGLPKINEVYHSLYPAKMWVYQPWLDKLGLDVPETTEEFYQMLQAFAQKDPNGNGLRDEVPLAATSSLGCNGYDEFLLNAFEYSTPERMKLVDGKVSTILTSETYREGLRYLNRLYSEGLMQHNSLIQDRKALTALGENPGTPVLGAAPGMWFGVFTDPGGKSGRYQDYVAIPPLKGPQGVRQTPYYGPDFSGSSFNITNNCKSPELAIRWVDYFYSEVGTLTSQYGQKGVGWDEAPEGAVGPEGEKAQWTRKKVFGISQNETWSNFGVMALTRQLRMRICDASGDTEERMYRETKEKYEAYGVKQSVPEWFLDKEEAAEFAELSQKLGDVVNQSVAAFTSGEKSLDADWEPYVSELKSLGLERLVALYQQAYDKSLE